MSKAQIQTNLVGKMAVVSYGVDMESGEEIHKAERGRMRSIHALFGKSGEVVAVWRGIDGVLVLQMDFGDGSPLQQMYASSVVVCH